VDPVPEPLENTTFGKGDLSGEKAKVTTLPKPGKDPMYIRLAYWSRPANVLKFILKIVQKHIEGSNLLDASQFRFRAHHRTALRYLRLSDHVTLNVNKNMSKAAVFFDIEKSKDSACHPACLLNNVFKL
jgi:hypothetical protein